MNVKVPPHEVAPALQVMMLDWMDSTAGWAETDEPARPRLLFVYEDRIGEVPIPPVALADHPRLMVKKMADIFEAARRSGEMGAKPRNLVAVGVLLEFWEIEFETAEEHDYWRRRDFAGHPRAVEARMLLAHQPGYRPVVAIHQRDRRGTGQKLDYPRPMMCETPLLPQGRVLPLLVHLERVARAVLAPPATFLAGR